MYYVAAVGVYGRERMLMGGVIGLGNTSGSWIARESGSNKHVPAWALWPRLDFTAMDWTDR